MIGFLSEMANDPVAEAIAKLFVETEKSLPDAKDYLKRRKYKKFLKDQSVIYDSFEYKFGFWHGIHAAGCVASKDFEDAVRNTPYYKELLKGIRGKTDGT